MSDDSTVPLTAGPPETVLDPVPAAVMGEIEAAGQLTGDARREALARVAAAHPALPEVWGRLAEAARDRIEGYAYARVGYHRGLDALRAAGWRGSGYVRWREVGNRGFLRSLDALRAAADAIGETAEAERCALFLRQLDPAWGPAGPPE